MLFRLQFLTIIYFLTQVSIKDSFFCIHANENTKKKKMFLNDFCMIYIYEYVVRNN